MMNLCKDINNLSLSFFFTLTFSFVTFSFDFVTLLVIWGKCFKSINIKYKMDFTLDFFLLILQRE